MINSYDELLKYVKNYSFTGDFIWYKTKSYNRHTDIHIIYKAKIYIIRLLSLNICYFDLYSYRTNTVVCSLPANARTFKMLLDKIRELNE